MAIEDASFPGFPPGAVATPIPNLFFTALLPQISDPAELVVSIYFFFAHARKKGRLAFLTYAELAADDLLAAALAPLAEGALRRGLDGAVERGTLLYRSVEHNGRVHELYFPNTPAGRRAVASLEAGRLDLGRVLPSPPAPSQPRPNIFQLYEQNIGPLTPLVAEYLKDAEEQYPADWLAQAFRIAVEQNKRSWSYIAAILRRWQAEGPDYEETGRDIERPRPRRPLSGRYRHLVRH